MSLNQIHCQDKTIAALQRAFAADKVAHAYIFAGPEGVGKFTTAKEFAKLLLCKKPTADNGFSDSCGRCESCRLADAGSHPDFEHIYKELREFTKDGKDKAPPVEFPIDVVREFLIEKVAAKPTFSARKIFVLSEAEKLNIASQNALLKVLEEPPAYCCIILLCTRPDKLFATIRSRCQTVRFGPIDEDIIIQTIQPMGLADTQARYFARLAQGSLGLACQWTKLQLADADICQIKTDILNSIAKAKYQNSIDLAGRLIENAKTIADAWHKIDPATSKSDISRKAQKTVVQIIIAALHDAMLFQIDPQKPLTNSDQRPQIELLARRFDPETAAEKIADCYKTLHWIESSVNERLIFEQLLLNLTDSDSMKV